MRIVCPSLFLSLCLALPFLYGQQPQAPQQAQPSGAQEAKKPGALEGRVVNAKTGEPIRRVTLNLRPFGSPGMTGGYIGPAMMGPGGPAAPYLATTDAEGKFRIENVEPGSYRLGAERQGFVRQEYGGRARSMMGTTINVAPSQELKELNIKLIPHAVITGRVLDEEGEPLARVQVQVLRERFFQGKKQLTPMGGGQSLDTGQFRIADLAPGKYWLSANYMNPGMMFGDASRSTSDKPEEVYVTTYYPGTADPASARPIDVVAGQELPGADIRMQKGQVFRIRGKVSGLPAGARNLRLMAFPRERSNSNMMMFGRNTAGIREDGSFEIGNLQPGSYHVTVMPMGPQSTVVGRVAVDVGRANVENVNLIVGQGVSIKGAIRLDGDVEQFEKTQGSKITFTSIRVQAMPKEGFPMMSPGSVAKEDGTFTLDNLGPDNYNIMVMGQPKGTWLKSIRSGDQEVLDSGIDLSGGSPGVIQITLGVGPGQITGSVQGPKQQPAAGSMVTLIPEPAKPDRNDLYRMATTDQNGQFTLQGITPGEYRLFAWEDLEFGNHMDPEFIKPHEGSAQKITVKENSQQQVTLTQIPADAN